MPSPVSISCAGSDLASYAWPAEMNRAAEWSAAAEFFVIYFGRIGGLMVAETRESRIAPVELTVARLEGAYEHLATKADIAALNAKLQLLQWITGIGFTIIAGLLIHMLGIIAA